jgi:DNA polymerase
VTGVANPRDALQKIAQELRDYLEAQSSLGVDALPPPPEVHQVAAAVPAPGLPLGRPAFTTLEEVRAHLGECTRCKLHQGRNTIVFGVGNPKADLVFVGEGPGAEEDAQGIPFVGRAGQLLTRIIEAIQLRREDVYICNIIKCRPPGNRNPEADEIAACEPFLKAQLAAIRPKLICCLGTFAAQTLLRTREPISRLRGRFHTYEGIPLLPTFHPAYLLRNPHEKRTVWEDMKLLQREYQRLTRRA